MNLQSAKRSLEKGFTLVELMIVVAVIAVLAGVAMPLYNGYVQSARVGVLVNNISSIEIFQEDFRLRTGAYLLVAADRAAITAAIGWTPQVADGTTYAITNPADGNYQVTATDVMGTVVCRSLPNDVAC